MTTTMQTILAETKGIGSYGYLIFIVVMIVLSVVRKVVEQKQQRDQAQKDASRRDEPPENVSRQLTAATLPPPQTAVKRLVRQQQPAAPAPTKLSDQVGTVGLGEGQARRLERQAQQRTRRFASRKVPEEAAATDIHTSLGRLTHRDEQVAEIAPGGLLAGLDLAGADALKRAIIYQEILSPPKAVRKDQGLWEQ